MLCAGCAAPSPGVVGEHVEGLVRRPDGTVLRTRYVEADGFALVWGDVIVGRPVAEGSVPEGSEHEVGARHDALADGAARPGRLWPGAVVPFELDPALPDRRRVDEAIAHWEARTPLRFVPRRGEADFVRFVPGSGCWSYVGRVGGAQEITLDAACDVGTVIHEIGHAIGLVHEHQRPDRDDHVTIHWDNLEEGAEPYFQTVDATPRGPYDTGSRMHYFPTAFSGRCDARGRCSPTITLRDGSLYEANHDGLSPLDVEGVRALYAGEDAPCAEVDRLSGPNRFATAIAVADAHAVDRSVAVVVSGVGGGVIDALSAGPFARSLSAPLILTAPDRLPEETERALRRWGTRTVFVIGGEGAVSAGVAARLESLPSVSRVERVAGATRFDTAARVAERRGAARTAFVVSGADASVSDALAAAGPAGQLDAPVLLVTRDTIPAETRRALERLGVRRTFVVGGPAAVSDAVLRALPSPRRLAGSSRFDTAAQVARVLARDEGVDASDAFLVRHDPIVDALAAGALGHVVFYATPEALPDATRAALRDLGLRASLLGGEAALSRRVSREVCVALSE